MKQGFLIVLIANLILASMPARGADDFMRSCSRVVRALRAADWKAFRAECADEIVFENIYRLYLQNVPAEVGKQLVGPPGWIVNDYLDGAQTEPAEANDQDVLISHRVTVARAPSADEKRAFGYFCGLVQDSYSWPTPPVSQGRNLQGEEVKSLIGPAIEGKVASSLKWRVQLELISGRWRVRKLITAAH